MQSKALADIAQTKMFIKRLQDNEAFYQASEESLRSELVAATMKSTPFDQLFDGVFL